MRTVGNILWLVAGVLACVLIITIPFGIASIKLAVLALVPLGTRVVDAQEARIPTYEVRRGS